MNVLDPCCGSKMFWYDKNNSNVVYGDMRKERHTLCDGRKLVIEPDLMLDYCALPFDDGLFNLVIFDPPHLEKGGDNSWMVKKYGRLPEDWRTNIQKGFTECFRVLSNKGTLIFKWNETQITVREILELSDYLPLFGHRSGKASNTHWISFMKIGEL